MKSSQQRYTASASSTSASSSASSTSASSSSNDRGRKTDLLCKFCYDAGQKGWNNHSFRNDRNQICCPYLLTQVKCGYCKQVSGHTTKYCPQIKNNNNKKPVSTPPPPASNISKPKQSVQKPLHQNRFGALSTIIEREEEENDEKQQTIEEHIKQFPPILTTSSQRVPSQTRISSSWSTIVSSKPKAADSKPKAADNKPVVAAEIKPVVAADNKPVVAAESKPTAAEGKPVVAAESSCVSTTFRTAANVNSWSDFMDEED